MRNLNLLRNSIIEKSLLTNFSKCFIFTEPIISRTYIFICTSSLEIYLLDFFNNALCNNEFIADLNKFNDISSTENASVISCDYLLNEACIILNTGHLIIVPTQPCSSENEISVLKLDVSDISLISWSFDLERTILVSSSKVLSMLCIMNNDYTKIIDFSLQDSLEEQNKFVSVEWGSTETQFRGSEGKYSKSYNSKEVSENLEDDTIKITWKSNSSAFAVSYVCCSEHIRKIKVFNQDGILLNVTKNIYGLQSVLNWCSSRNLITCVQKLPNKKVVCFLEENALRHGDFQIPEHITVIELCWNINGSILACHGTNEKSEFIMLWTTNNYKWYLKQNLKFKNRIRYMQWDYTFSNKLHVILESGIYRMFEWSFQITESSKCKSSQNLSIVAVINGKNIACTPYRLVRQPPSMPYTNYEFSSCINTVIFPKMASAINDETNFNCNSMMLYVDNSELLSLTQKNDTYEIIGPYIFTFSDKNLEIDFCTPVEMSAWLWLLPNLLYFNWSRLDGYYFCVSCIDIKTHSVIIKNMMKLESLIATIVNYKNDVIIHLEDGPLFIYQNKKCLPLNIIFKEPCFSLLMLKKNIILALSENKNMYINENIKFRDIISFYWKPPFLILLTMDSKLLITKVDFSENRADFNEVSARNIEPKSYLVTVVDDEVILEMERGNLEIIKPRPFTIFKMEKLLKDKKYFEVFKMLRNQRINLNVIFDYDPLSFLENIKQIVEKVTDPIYLMMLITELENENVAQKMFPWKYNKIYNYNIENKVQTVCNALCTCIKELNISTYILPLIAALIKQNELAEAAKYAIEYNKISSLFQFSDAKSMYEAALASYDLPCALKIGEHSKMDPSEYLQFINELQATEENYRKFKICDYLNNHPEALKYLANCESDSKFEECINYILKYNLYNEALHIFSVKKNSVINEEQMNIRYLRIMATIAEYYYTNKLYNEAAILFEKANLLDRATYCYILIGDWITAVSMLKYLGYKKSKIKHNFQQLFDSLQEKRQYENAALIAYNFLEDSEKAVESYLIAKKYCNSINAAKGLRNERIIKFTIKPKLIEEKNSITENFSSECKLVNEHFERLCVVKENKRNTTHDDDDDRGSYISSGISDTCSLSSCDSRTSSFSTSSKRARRRERKLWNLKKGNPREELSLINAIREIIENSNRQLLSQVPDLIKGLIKVDEINLAQDLQARYSSHLKYLNEIKTKVWSLEELKEEGGFKDIQIKYPPDISISGWELKII